MGRNRIVNGKQSLAFSTADVHNPAANTAAVVTYAAVAGSSGTAAVGNQPVPVGLVQPAATSHVIQGLRATVSVVAGTQLAAPPLVQIEDGSGNVVFKTHLNQVFDFIGSQGPAGDVTLIGPSQYVLQIEWPLPRRGTPGRALIITMPANGAAATNKLCILGHWTELA